MKNILEYFNLKWLELVALYLFLEGGYLEVDILSQPCNKVLIAQ
jgi:hypothetical protein